MPAQYIADWLLGPDLSVDFIYPATQDGNGNFVDGVPVTDFNFVVRRVGHTARTLLKDLRPITVAEQNMVPVGTGTSCSLTQLKTKGNTQSNGGQMLNYLRAAGSHAHLFWREAHEYFDGYFVLGDLESGMDGVEEQPASIALEPVALANRSQVQRGFDAYIG